MKYAIWDKKSTIYTPSGTVFTAEQWIARHPIAENPNVTIICADDEFNGAFFGTLRQLENVYGKNIDFSVCTTDEEKVEEINTYLEEQNAMEAAKAEDQTAEERIAAALEYQVMASLPDEEITEEV